MKTETEDILCTLLAARTLIDVEGWTTKDFGDLQDCGGKHCAWGAVVAVMPDDFTGLSRTILEAADWKSPLDGVIGWNDAPGRTKAQVLKAFDKAIARLEREGA